MSSKQAFIDGIVNAVANRSVGYSQGAARLVSPAQPAAGEG